jgi:hypothetical protein
VDDWKKAVGFRETASFDVFSQKLSRLIDTRIPELVRRHGDKVYFTAKSTETLRADAAETGDDD